MPPQDLDHVGMADTLYTAAGEEHVLDLYRSITADQAESIKILERCWAKALDAQVTAEKARDYARAECQRLLEENRKLKADDADDWFLLSHNASPLTCEHANECPVSCPCEDGCYCKTRTCKS